MITRSRWLKWIWLALVLAGCGGAAKAPAGYPRSSDNASPSSVSYEKGATPGAGMPGDSVPMPSPAPPPAGTSFGPTTESQPAPRERPGLGTEWGETRESRVRSVGFTRADADRPFAVASLYYNDREGIAALAKRFGGAFAIPRDIPARGGMITVSIRDESGEPLLAQRLGDRMYVVGQAGQRYTITLSNHTPHRFEAVVTVDGLDVINGRTGSLQNRGYVLMPYATVEIDGFRQSMDAVAAFRFGKVSDSYAAQTGSARNVGVIGCAFFSEIGDRYTDDELNTRESANPFPGSDPRFARPPR
jgi:hypothetical protein